MACNLVMRGWNTVRLRMTGYAALLVVTAAMGSPVGERPNAMLLKSGEFVFGDFRGDTELGRSRITIARKADGQYLFSNEVIGHAAQTWTAVAGVDFEPVAAVLEFRGEGEAHQPIFDIHYKGGRVTGSRRPRQPPGAAPILVDDAAEPGVIDQRIDWASVMARKLKIGLMFNFQVYDPAIATSAGSAMVEDGGRIHVPAGDFDTFKITYQIGKKTGSERYVVFASKALPRILVREDFPDGVSSMLENAS
jgi:hypothetical protein